MSYTPNISLQLDIDYAGMASNLRGQLYDGATQSTVGDAISGVFFERPGAQAMYIMRPVIPSGHDGWCDIYVDGAPETVIGFFSINPVEIELPAIVAALLAGDIETGHSLLVVLRSLYALLRNNSEADDATNPTTADYYAPDGETVRVHHDLTPTTRTVT